MKILYQQALPVLTSLCNRVEIRVFKINNKRYCTLHSTDVYMTKKIISSLLFILIIFPVALLADSFPDKKFFELKEKAEYSKALEYLTSQIVKEKNPVSAEAGLFLINSIINTSEMFRPAIDSYNKIAQTETVKKNPMLKERLKIFKRDILLRSGRFKEAENLTLSLGYIDFLIAGPFPARGEQDFSKKYPPEIKFDPSQEMDGSVHKTGWFNAPADLTGRITPANFADNTENSIFYLTKEITVPKDRIYTFTFGKTGFTDIRINNKKVFSDRQKHGFCHDQYKFTIHLSAGKHRILVKTGDNSGRLEFSMRISEKQAETPGIESTASSYFNSLEKLTSQTGLCEQEIFLKALLLFSSNITSENPLPLIEAMNKLPEESIYRPALCYLIAVSQKEDKEKDYWLNRTLGLNPKNTEALFELGILKLKTSFFKDAFDVSQKIEQMNPNSVLHHILQSEIYIKRNWQQLVNKHTKKLADKNEISTSSFIELHSALSQDRFHEAELALQNIIRQNRYDINSVYKLAQIYKKRSDNKKLIKLLRSYIPVFPDRTDLVLELSDAIKIIDGPGKALPYLSAAARRSPYNRQVLLQTGLLYHRIGKKKLALYYLNRAKIYNPEDYDLKKYIELISSTKDELRDFEHKENIISLNKKADQYIDEAAVVLLDENIFRIHTDGSMLHRVRKVIKINSSTVLDEFKHQYVVITPGTDTIEKIRCTVTNRGKKIKIKNRYRRSLFRPESRLYYNLEAEIIPVSSLSPGSIIDFSYTLKKKKDPGFKNYSGARIILGSQHRTIASNTVVIYNNSSPVYLFTKRLGDEEVTYKKLRDKTAAVLTLENITPLIRERAMPDSSEFLPCLYFTSLKNWQELHTWYSSLLENRTRLDDKMKKDLESIIIPTDPETEKVKKIYRHVTDEIRYAGFELGVGGIRPRRTDNTYNSKMGDCKDISLVLAGLLNHCGIQAKLALVRTADKGKPDLDVPFLGSFNHAICYVKTGKGENQKEFFLDGTARNTGFMELPDDDRNITAFIIDPDGYSFKKTDSPFYEKNIQSVKNRIIIDSNGNAIMRRLLVKKGTTAASSRRELLQKARKEKALNEYWNKRFTGSRISSLNIAELNNDLPVEYSYTVLIPSFAQVDNNKIIFNSMLMTSNYYDNYAISKQRKYPINISYTGKTTVTIDYIIPDGFRVTHLPKGEKFINPDFNADFRYTVTGNSIRVYSSISIKSQSVKNHKYLRFRDFALFINRKEMERIVLSSAEN